MPRSEPAAAAAPAPAASPKSKASHRATAASAIPIPAMMSAGKDAITAAMIPRAASAMIRSLGPSSPTQMQPPRVGPTQAQVPLFPKPHL